MSKSKDCPFCNKTSEQAIELISEGINYYCDECKYFVWNCKTQYSKNIRERLCFPEMYDETNYKAEIEYRLYTEVYRPPTHCHVIKNMSGN